MSLKSKVELKIDARTRKIAETILWEIRAECPKKSGRSARSFRIEKVGRNYKVVSNKLSAYYADQGNGGKGTRIYPKHAKALKITNGVNRTLTRENGKPLLVASVRGYDGDGYIARVADRHR